MHRLAESKLLAGFIYGDPHMQEYIYLPGSELDAASPMLVYETGKERHDVDMQEALSLIEKRSLRPCNHRIVIPSVAEESLLHYGNQHVCTKERRCPLPHMRQWAFCDRDFSATLSMTIRESLLSPSLPVSQSPSLLVS